MFRSLMLSLVCSGIFLACNSYQPTQIASVQATNEKISINYFSGAQDYVYSAKISIYGHNMSGLMMLKKINDSTHRVAMTSDFGNKLIDFEISSSQFKIHYILPDLDRTMVKNLLHQDFKILLQKDFHSKQKFITNEEIVYHADGNYLSMDKDLHLLKKIVHTRNGREKVHYLFVSKNSILADEIEIDHKDFKINIKLSLLEENIAQD